MLSMCLNAYKALNAPNVTSSFFPWQKLNFIFYTNYQIKTTEARPFSMVSLDPELLILFSVFISTSGPEMAQLFERYNVRENMAMIAKSPDRRSLQVAGSPGR